MPSAETRSLSSLGQPPARTRRPSRVEPPAREGDRCGLVSWPDQPCCADCRTGSRCGEHRHGLPGQREAAALDQTLRAEGRILDHFRPAAPEHDVVGRNEARANVETLVAAGRVVDHAKGPSPQQEVLALVGGLDRALTGGVDALTCRLLEDVGLPTVLPPPGCTACDQDLACDEHHYGLLGPHEREQLFRELEAQGMLIRHPRPDAGYVEPDLNVTIHDRVRQARIRVTEEDEDQSAVAPGFPGGFSLVCPVDLLLHQLGPSSFTLAPTSDTSSNLMSGLQVKLELPTAYGAGALCSATGQPILDLLGITSTPIVVGDWLVFGVYYPDPAGCLPLITSDPSLRSILPYEDSLLGLYIPSVAAGTPEVYVLNEEGGATEATLLFDPEACLIYWPHFGSAAAPRRIVTVLDAVTFATVAQHDEVDADGKATVGGVDSSGVLTPDGYVFGTVNGPGQFCNEMNLDTQDYDGESPACGAVMAASISGSDLVVTAQIGTDNKAATGYSFRSWVGASVTADDNDTLYIGATNTYAYELGESLADTLTGRTYHNDTLDPARYEYRFGCSAVRAILLGTGFDPVHRSDAFDPGDVESCRKNALDEFRSAPAGEIVVTSTGEHVWAQFNSNNYDDPDKQHTYQTYAIETSGMTETCEFVFDGGSSNYRGGKPFQAPTLATDGIAYVIYGESPTNAPGLFPEHTRLLGLARGDLGGWSYCLGPLKYDRIDGERAFHAPTLVSGEDRYGEAGDYVLVATDDSLYVFDQHMATTAALLRVPLGHGDAHQASPVVHDGVTYLLSERGFLTILPSPVTGDAPDSLLPTSYTFTGYGDAVWPRFRADNCGSGRPNGNPLCR